MLINLFNKFDDSRWKSIAIGTIWFIVGFFAGVRYSMRLIAFMFDQMMKVVAEGVSF